MVVGILMGSDSDLPIMKGALDVFETYNIPYEVKVISAHRTPVKAMEYAVQAREKGLKVIIAGAGMAAHLAGVLAAYTTLPVIGVPIASGPLQGQDALYSTVQMPPGIPVATMAINGARNAAIFALQIMAVTDKEIEGKLDLFKENMIKQIEEKEEKLNKAITEARS